MAGNRVLFDHNGKPIDLDNPDDMALPHVYTFGSLYDGGWQTYIHEHYDEAMRHRRENGLAMYRDLYLQSLLRERANGTMRLKWSLEADNGEDPTEKAAAELVAKAIRGIRRLRWLRLWTLRGPLWYGRYGVQVKWGWTTINAPTVEYSGPAEAGMKPNVEVRPQRVLTIKQMVPLNGDKLGYRWDGTPYVLAGAAVAFAERHGYEYVYTTGGPGVLLNDPRLRRQIIIGTYDPEDADYYEPEMGGGRFGLGIRSRIYWMDWMRNEYRSWVTDAFERIGLGLVVIYYEDGNPQAETQARETAKRYNRRSALIMPRSKDRSWQNGAVEVVEAPISGAQVVMQLFQAIEAQEERFIIGQSMSGGADKSNGLGGSGRAMLAGDTKMDLIAADAEDHAETLTGGDIDKEPGLVNMVHRWSLPHLWGKFPLRWKYQIDDGMMAMAKMEMLQAAAAMVEVRKNDVYETAGIQRPEDGDEVIGGPQMQQAMAAAGQQPGGGGMPGMGASRNGKPLMPGGGKGEPDLEALMRGAGAEMPGGNGMPAGYGRVNYARDMHATYRRKLWRVGA